MANSNTPASSNSAEAIGNDFPFTDGRFHGVEALPPTPLGNGVSIGLPLGSLMPPKPTVDAQGRTLNPRSCVTCRRRKVKCDKTHPCANCNRAHIECIFPSPGRAPRRVKKAGEGTGRDKELLERLRRLEGVVKGLGVEVPGGLEEAGKDEAEVDAGAESRRNSNHEPEMRQQAGSEDGTAALKEEADGAPKPKRQHTAGESQGNAADFAAKSRWVDETSQGRFENRFGRLVVNEGKSRYINNSFWANLSNEVEDLKGILNHSDDSDIENAESPNGSANAFIGGQHGNHHGFVFGFSSQSVDMLSLHPLPQQVGLYWQTFKENVDPLAKVLHIPTVEPTVLRASSHLSNLSKGFEALLFCIYYGAVTSLSGEDCFARFNEEKTVLLSRYRFAIEQALARANFLTTEEIIVLQALVVFLICLRRNNDARVIWTLTGLVVRIAQTIGIHRDGAHFGLMPFEVEMRRRLWWQVCILDTRASEDHGCDPTIIEQAFDTKMPLNVNDVDISPDMKVFPPERQGCTDMSFCLIRFEVAGTFRRINYIPPGPPRACQDLLTSVSLQDKEKWITECHNRLEERYLKNCDMTVPLFWVTATVARLMMSKMWLMVYHPFQRQDGGASLPEETKEKLFITSLENIEYSLLLETEARTMKWGWLFKTYMQWHALAFILSELCVRTTGDLVERAWVAVEKTRDGRWGETVNENDARGHLWRPLKKLYRKAKEARSRGLQEEQLDRQRADGTKPVRHYSPNANPMFGHPQRPTMVRAPLSRAQASRFMNGPVFGERPLDSHELLKSPKLTELADSEIQAGDVDLMDIAGDRGGFAGSLAKSSPDHSLLVNINPFDRHSSQAHTIPPEQPQAQLFSPKARQPMPEQFKPASRFGQHMLSKTGITDFNSIDLTSPNLTSTPLPNQTNNFTAQTPQHVPTAIQQNNRMDSIDSNAGFDPLMDTSGDLDWENWDQMVRSWGMDVDSGPPEFVDSSTAFDLAGGGMAWDPMMGDDGFGGDAFGASAGNGNAGMGNGTSQREGGVGGGGWM